MPNIIVLEYQLLKLSNNCLSFRPEAAQHNAIRMPEAAQRNAIPHARSSATPVGVTDRHGARICGARSQHPMLLVMPLRHKLVGVNAPHGLSVVCC